MLSVRTEKTILSLPAADSLQWWRNAERRAPGCSMLPSSSGSGGPSPAGGVWAGRTSSGRLASWRRSSTPTSSRCTRCMRARRMLFWFWNCECPPWARSGWLMTGGSARLLSSQTSGQTGVAEMHPAGPWWAAWLKLHCTFPGESIKSSIWDFQEGPQISRFTTYWDPPLSPVFL